MSDNRRKQEGKSGAWTSPLNAVTDMLAAAWGTAVGIGCTVFGIKRDKTGQASRSGGSPRPERPQTEASARSRQQGGAAAKPEPPAKVAPVRKDSGRSAAAGTETKRRGARQAAPAKTGTAAKAPGGSDKGAPQRSAARRGRAAATPAEPRSGARTAPRPKASDKHPAPPRPGEAARADPPATTPATAPAMAPANAKPQRPAALDSARGGKADDLKQIAGIGPKLEEKLNGLGIYHYDQIAGWGDSDIAWIDAELQAKGRVERDNWVGQAAALMSGAKPSGGEGSAA